MVLLSFFFANVLCSISPLCFPTYAPPTVSEQRINTRSSFSEVVDHWPVVETLEGNVRGFPMTTVGGRDIHAFDGIPFAEPPTGRRRFRSPVRKKRWTGIWNADTRTNNCIQLDLTKFYTVTGSEDCLYLNVYTPVIPRNKTASKLPVIVFFFGGAFFFGSKDHYGPAYFLEKDIVLITLNYRLGALGFLSTGDDASPGNYGLKDQLMGLEWIKDNIDSFGGDPNKVTLMGESAGGASVHLHMLSKRSRGLFQAGISQSASAFNPWSIYRTPAETALKFSKNLNCNFPDSHQMIKCLRKQSAHDITAAQVKLQEWLNHPTVTFAPVVEHNHSEAFLTEHPRDLYAKGDVAKVPWIIGFVPNEGNIYNILMILIPISFFSFNRNFQTLAPMTLGFRGLGLKEDEIARKIKRQYFGDENITYRNMKTHGDMYGDRNLLTGIYEAMLEHSKWAPTYGYFFNYSGRFSVLERVGMTREEAGISHYDDVIYLFNSSALHPSLSYADKDFEMVELITDLWANFASKKKPLHTNSKGEEVDVWTPLNHTQPRLLEISRTPGMIEFPVKFLKRIEFWQNLKIPD